MISLEDLFQINKELVNTFGGMGVGFNSLHLAESLISQIDQEVFGKVLYPTLEDKISFIVFSIIANHVFLDGNKRTGAFVLEKLCVDNSISLSCSDDEIIDLVVRIARSEYTREDVCKWIRCHVRIPIKMVNNRED